MIPDPGSWAWERSYPPGVRWDTPVAPSTLPAMFADAIARHGRRSAIEFRDRAIGFDRLGVEVERTAAAFLRAGLGPDTSIAFYLPNTPYHPIALFAAAKAGARGVLLSPLDSERTLAQKLKDSEARTLVTTNFASMMPMAMKLLDAGAIDRVIVGDDAVWGESPIPLLPIPNRHDVISLTSFVAEGGPPVSWPAVMPDQIALLQYTGGTTGLPKGAMLTHANLTVAVAMYDTWLIGQGMSRPGQDRIICALPLFHIYALTTILLRHIKNGNAILLHVKFDAEAVLRDIEARQATSFCGVPTMWIALSSVPGVEHRNLTSLRYCASGGAPLPIEVAERCERLFGRRMVGGWGMTETAPAGTHLPGSGPRKPGTIGVPLPGIAMDVVSLADPRRVLPPGEIGEIRIKGPNVTAGYWKRPEETAAAFVDGFFLTGDVGKMDEDGYFFLVDRKKDMIISGGFNVYPAVIEQAIYEHPDVEEAVVIGVPDDYRGEAAKAFVKLRQGAAALTLEALRDFLKDKLGKHELPAALELREALPRTPVGKLSRLDLRAEERARRSSLTAEH
jgi:long-chain acyl-CoA synthetase